MRCNLYELNVERDMQVNCNMNVHGDFLPQDQNASICKPPII